MLKSVSVIIPTYNRANLISRTLESFVAQNYPSPFEIIVVDNNSSDNTETVVMTYARKYPIIKYIREDRQGVHYARNGAVKHAKYDVLYFTDDDMIADPALLSNLIPTFDIDPEIATVGGRVLPHWEVSPPKWILKYCVNGLLSLNLDDSPMIISTQLLNVYSCHQAILKAALIEAGGFNPENTQGNWVGDGETGLAIKLLDLNYKMAYNGNSVIAHIIPQSRTTQSYLNQRLANQGNCDSYTVFKSVSGGISETTLRSNIKSHRKLLAYHIYATIWNACTFNDLWRMNLARIYYYSNRIKYDKRLIKDQQWRTFVLQNNWMDQ